jgi:hypothetical protein
MTVANPWRRPAQLAVAGLLVLVAAVSVSRGWRLQFDFDHFYLDARYVWSHGALNPDTTNAEPLLRRQLPFYLPVVPLALAPLTAGGVEPAAIAWTALHVAALAYALWVLRRRYLPDTSADPAGSRAPGRADAAFVLASILAAVAVFEAAKFNQMTFIVLALVLGGTENVARRRWLAGGTLLAVATLLKLVPGVFVVWLTLKREWRALGAWAGAMLVLGVLPPLLAFGPQRTWRYHREWFDYNVPGVLSAGLRDEPRRTDLTDHTNQSLRVVIERVFNPEHPYRAPWQPLQLTSRQCAVLSAAIVTVLAATLMVLTRRPRWRLPVRQRRAEVAVYLLAMLALGPLVRQYYLVWALPAVVIFAGWERHGAALNSRGRLGLALWVLGQLAWTSPTARLYGAQLWVLLALAGVLLATNRAMRPGARVARIGSAQAGAATSSVPHR